MKTNSRKFAVAGIIGGSETWLAGKFGVNENCSRGQIVTILYRAKSI